MTEEKLIKTPAEIAAEGSPAKLIGLTIAREAQRGAFEAGRAPTAQIGAGIADAGAGLADATESVSGLITAYQQQSLQRASEAMQALWQCRTLSDLLSLQMRFVTESWQDGLDRMGRLATLSMQQAGRGVETAARR